MSIIPQVADAMQEVLINRANIAGVETGFIQRQRKLTGSLFVQTAVFSWLANPQASYTQMSQTAAAIGVDITPQSIEERFNEKAADTLLATLEAAVEQMVDTLPNATALLERFNGVYLHDSSCIQLPNELADCFVGCGGKGEQSGLSAVKLHLRWDILSGKIDHLSLTDGKTNDKSDSISLGKLPSGCMRIADLGYFSLEQLKQLDSDGVLWLSKLQGNTAVFDTDGKAIDLHHWVFSQPHREFERQILLGTDALIPSRLLVTRVSDEEATQRRRRIKKQAKSKGRTPSQRRLQLAGYNISITNAPASMLCVAEAMVLYRVRWQIELLFKLYKNHGEIDQWTSGKKWRILCEIYAKLIAMVIGHWLLLCSGFIPLYHSLFKAAQGIKTHALSIGSALGKGRIERLIQALQTVAVSLIAGTRIYKRCGRPTTIQRLEELTNSLVSP